MLGSDFDDFDDDNSDGDPDYNICVYSSNTIFLHLKSLNNF